MQQIPLFHLNEDPLPLKNAITVTGSRQLREERLESLFKSSLSSFLGKESTWLLGGAIGIDHLVTNWLLDQNETVIAVVPFLVKDQPQAVRETLTRVSRCVELGQPKSKKAYLDRNAFMVERSGIVIAFWNGEKGGTWATIQHALKLRKQVHVYPIAGD